MLQNILKLELRNNKSLLFIMISLVFLSCQKEESSTGNSNITNEAISNWMKADLETLFDQGEMNYPIDNQKLFNLASLNNATQIQFIPGVIDDKLWIKATAVDHTTGEVLGEEWIEQATDSKVLPQIVKMKELYDNTSNLTDPIIQEHKLSYNQLLNYISDWTEKSMYSVEELVTFNGERLNYICFPSEVIKHISNLDTEYTTIAWGINEHKKITTVFVPAAANRNDQLPGFDGGLPCPPDCD